MRVGPTFKSARHYVNTIGFDLNDTKQLIDEISIEKVVDSDENGEVKRSVELKVYESSFFEYLSHLCTKEISFDDFSVFFPITNLEEFEARVKSFFLGNKLIHVSALREISLIKCYFLTNSSFFNHLLFNT